MSDSTELLTFSVEGLTPEENELVSLIAANVGYKDACKRSGISERRFQVLRVEKPAFSGAVSRARRLAQDLKVDSMEEIARTEPDNQRAKNILDTIKWTASKVDKEQYGDKLQVDHQVTVNIGEALANARARVARPSCDPALAIDAEYVDVSIAYNQSATDSASQAPTPVVPDIFS